MLDATQRSSVIFSAYAKLPAGITAYEVHKVIGVVVEIDMHTRPYFAGGMYACNQTCQRFYR